MTLSSLFDKWMLNHNHFAHILGIPKGTFNNKLNPSNRGKFKDDEILELKKLFKAMMQDLESFIYLYPEQEEDLTGIIDEVPTYNGKPIE